MAENTRQKLRADERSEVSETRRINGIWRQMKSQDMAAVIRLAALCYPDLPESAAVLAEKQRLAPQYCFSLVRAWPDAAGEEMLGYMLAHPWRRDSVPALNSPLGGLPPNADSIYLHDLALAPEAHGRGLAGAAVAKLCAAALSAGFVEIALTAVHNSAPFWRKQGFAPQPISGKNLLQTYGAGAVFMVKNLRA